ncbi:hypothetical protein GPJ56_002113 [Histomonas meleagridis]|uniref:uncharacterized protein n=1 Tax=Histomonas meleagridis TaxID=135588 RepID=UPI00355A3A02|nr:hypothetical protein GPJ56_002113 [Histomonas meleagridis]KAH0806710.1 hypothetical protein GO595_000561 [Histomonas meleagridis]
MEKDCISFNYPIMSEYNINLTFVSATLDQAEVKRHTEHGIKNAWFVITTDGAASPTSTASAPISPSMTFNYPINISLISPRLDNVCIYFTLCTFGRSQNEMYPIARSRSRISKLPLNSNGTFTLPLMSQNKKVASVTLIGTIQEKTNPGYPNPPMQNPIQPQIPQPNPVPPPYPVYQQQYQQQKPIPVAPPQYPPPPPPPPAYEQNPYMQQTPQNPSQQSHSSGSDSYTPNPYEQVGANNYAPTGNNYFY